MHIHSANRNVSLVYLIPCLLEQAGFIEIVVSCLLQTTDTSITQILV